MAHTCGMGQYVVMLPGELAMSYEAQIQDESWIMLPTLINKLAKNHLAFDADSQHDIIKMLIVQLSRLDKKLTNVSKGFARSSAPRI